MYPKLQLKDLIDQINIERRAQEELNSKLDDRIRVLEAKVEELNIRVNLILSLILD